MPVLYCRNGAHPKVMYPQRNSHPIFLCKLLTIQLDSGGASGGRLSMGIQYLEP